MDGPSNTQYSPVNGDVCEYGDAKAPVESVGWYLPCGLDCKGSTMNLCLGIASNSALSSAGMTVHVPTAVAGAWTEDTMATALAGRADEFVPRHRLNSALSIGGRPDDSACSNSCREGAWRILWRQQLLGGPMNLCLGIASNSALSIGRPARMTVHVPTAVSRCLDGGYYGDRKSVV